MATPANPPLDRQANKQNREKGSTSHSRDHELHDIGLDRAQYAPARRTQGNAYSNLAGARGDHEPDDAVNPQSGQRQHSAER